MPIKIDFRLTPQALLPKLNRAFELSAEKILSIEKTWEVSHGTPVFTRKGRYTSRGWTEWTQGFQFGSALLQFDATDDKRFLELGRQKTVQVMASHVSHIGVHDHGFNNISTYGNLWRLMREGRISFQGPELDFYSLALKISGAVQAARWTSLGEGQGFIYSFNGPHSLFVDTMRSLRSLAVAHQLGHVLMGEADRKISLLERLVVHACATARYSIYYGEGRDEFDVRGRTAQECIFNLNDGNYRCANTQQGYSPFSTWTRGLSWGLLGFAEQLEYLKTLKSFNGSSSELSRAKNGRKGGDQLKEIKALFQRAATAAAEFFLENTCTDGIPFWDTAPPNLYRLGDCLNKPSDPFNGWEPVDSSAAAICAQGLIRLGNYLASIGAESEGSRYCQAGLTITRTLLEEPYLSSKATHQGLLLHSVYHRPNGWDHVAPGQKVPNGESSMWGDYHLRELSVLVSRQARQQAYPTFFATNL